MTDMLVAIRDVNGLLRLKTYPLRLQFDAKSILVNTFEQSRRQTRCAHSSPQQLSLPVNGILFNMLLIGYTLFLCALCVSSFPLW